MLCFSLCETTKSLYICGSVPRIANDLSGHLHSESYFL